MSAAQTWRAFEGWTVPQRDLDWRKLDPLFRSAHEYAELRCARLPELLADWDLRLEDLGGDPSRSDWRSFRPLRVEREEHWSDWLQHLLAESRSGIFAQVLLSRDAPTIAAEVIREDATETRRADLTIQWENDGWSQIEVKVWDLHLEKTCDTAEELERKHGGTWIHYLLLPAEHVSRWLPETARVREIVVVTWTQVAIALRRALLSGNESRAWRTWAHAFCGAVEQKILGHLPTGTRPVRLEDLAARLAQITVLEGGLR